MDTGSCLRKNRPKESDDKKNIAVNDYDVSKTKLNRGIDYTFSFLYSYEEYSKDDFIISDIYSSAMEVKTGYKNYSYYFIPLTREEHSKRFC